MAFYQPRSRRIPEATDKRGEKIFESKTHCEVGFVLEALRSHEPGRWLGVAQTMPRRINAPSDYHPQKIFAVASLNALLQNRDAIFDHQRPNAATAMAQAQAAIALRFNNPAFYVSREILNAALRTDLPSDLVLEAIPFPFPAIIFVLPIGGVRHETEGDIPYICVSRFYGDEIVPLSISGYDFPLRIENPSVSVTTYMHQAQLDFAHFELSCLVSRPRCEKQFAPRRWSG